MGIPTDVIKVPAYPSKFGQSSEAFASKFLNMFFPFQGNSEVSDGFLQLNFCIVLPKTIKCVFFRLTTSRFCLYLSSVDCTFVLSVSMVCSNVLAAVCSGVIRIHLCGATLDSLRKVVHEQHRHQWS